MTLSAIGVFYFIMHVILKREKETLCYRDFYFTQHLNKIALYEI